MRCLWFDLKRIGLLRRGTAEFRALKYAQRLRRKDVAKWVATRHQAAGLISAIVLCAYVGLLPAGHWQGDEFFGASLIAQQEWRFLISGLSWAPRPIGLTLGWLYIAVSNGLDRPLIGVFLFCLWFACFCGIATSARLASRAAPTEFATILFALTLLVSKPGEMFYWPVGAAAYLPCWAGLAGVTIVIGNSFAPRRALTACLMLSALSLEVGSVAVLIFSSLAVCVSALDGRWRRLSPLALPVLCSAIVCLTVLHGRIQPVQATFNPSLGTGGNWLASLRAAVPAFLSEALGISGWPLPAGAALKIVLVLCLPRSGAAAVDKVGVLLWACALLFAAFTSEVLAFEQFGALCCERHVTQRQSMILLALFCLADLRPKLSWLTPRLSHGAQIIVLLGLLCARSGALITDWQRLPHSMSILHHNWKFALRRGGTLRWVTETPGAVVNGDGLPAGHYQRCSETASCEAPWFAKGIMDRFQKQSLDIVAEPR